MPTPLNTPLLRRPAAGNFRKLEKAVAVFSILAAVARVVNKDGHESRRSGTTATSASSITPVPAITTYINDPNNVEWVSKGIDDNGALRTAAWEDGGVNDICPAGFSVPTEEELKVDTTLATTTKVDDTATAFSRNWSDGTCRCCCCA
jgi:hypothetical protein